MIIQPTEQLLNALGCAVGVLNGDRGEYSPKEKSDAIDQLLVLKEQVVKGLLDGQTSTAS